MIRVGSMEETCPYCGRTYERELIGSIEVPKPCNCEMAIRQRKKQSETETLNRRKTALRAHLRAGNLPPLYWTAGLENETLKSALNRSKGVYLFGGVGSGKTYAAAGMAIAAAKSGKRFYYVNEPLFLAEVRSGFTSGADSERMLLEVSSEPLLILDDLGKTKPSSWVVEVLYRIIEKRYQAMLPTIVTSNYGITELERRYVNTGERETVQAIVSRLCEMCVLVNTGSVDMRITKGAKQ